MSIAALVRKDNPKISPYSGVASIKKDLTLHSALIVEESGIYYGILTATDLVNKPYNLVIDCISHVTTIEANTALSQAILIMKQENTEILQVFENKKFIGIIHKNDILDRLSKKSKKFIESEKDKQSKLDEDKNHFFHSVIHDLKSPVENIYSLIAILQKNKKDIPDEKILEYVSVSCNNAKNIINNLLEIAEIENTNHVTTIQNTDINRLLKIHLAPFISIAKKKNIKIIKQLSKAPLLFETNPEKLIRVVNNIISNALKFTHNGGQISVSTLKVADKIVIKICDTGIGIPLELQKNIFEKFTKSKRTGLNGEKANGLGMHIVKQIVNSINGQIWIESDGKSGTTVFVELPEDAQRAKGIRKNKNMTLLNEKN